jgi:hypothetical protein
VLGVGVSLGAVRIPRGARRPGPLRLPLDLLLAPGHALLRVGDAFAIPRPPRSSGGYDALGPGWSLRISVLTRVNEPLDVSTVESGSIRLIDGDGTPASVHRRR